MDVNRVFCKFLLSVLINLVSRSCLRHHVQFRADAKLSDEPESLTSPKVSFRKRFALSTTITTNPLCRCESKASECTAIFITR
jgi:hypothetical protein